MSSPLERCRSLARLALLFLGAGLLHSATAANGQPREGEVDYPSRPIRFVAPTSVGGGTDVLARLFGVRMTENWGQPVVIDNRPGGATIVGTEVVARAAPNGYTILMVANGYALNPYLYSRLPYDSLKDFERVMLFTFAPVVLVAHPSVPTHSIKDLIALAQAKPGQLNYASSGVGTAGWLSFELFQQMASLTMVHIPYKGAGQATAAVIGGEVNLLFTATIAAAPHIKSGRLRVLGVTSAKRTSIFPDVPAISETLPGFDVQNWFGVLVPAKTPITIITKLQKEIARIMELPDLRANLIGLGFEPVNYGPEQFTAYVQSEMTKWSRVFRERGIKPE